MAGLGSPLSIAVLGVSSMEKALSFYRDVIGLDASDEVLWKGNEFEEHWQQPQGSSARAILFSAANLAVGRVLALQFDAEDRLQVSRQGDRTYRGLWNLNFYVDDIRSTTKNLLSRGYNFWSAPVSYEVSASAGQPVEVLFDGPDNVAINLVELTGDETSTVGRILKEVELLGKTPTGFTPVATTSHSVTDRSAALAFYQQVLKMEVIIDDVLDKPETNLFLNRPEDAKTRATFVTGNHVFGKVALSHPLNYEVPDRIADAVPPNIGYLAQSFLIPSLSLALEACRTVGAKLFSPQLEINLPGIGKCLAAVVRNPGSGALMQLLERR